MQRLLHRRIVSPTSTRELKTMLTGVVDEHGATGNEAAIPGYSVAGKTGTAQKPGPNGYTPGKYVASFVGMVPVKHPRLLVLVVVDEPHARDLRRHRRSPGLRPDREVRPPVPRPSPPDDAADAAVAFRR